MGWPCSRWADGAERDGHLLTAWAQSHSSWKPSPLGLRLQTPRRGDCLGRKEAWVCSGHLAPPSRKTPRRLALGSQQRCSWAPGRWFPQLLRVRSRASAALTPRGASPGAHRHALPRGPARRLCPQGSRIGAEKAVWTTAEETLCAALLPILCCGWDRGGSCERVGGSTGPPCHPSGLCCAWAELAVCAGGQPHSPEPLSVPQERGPTSARPASGPSP